MFAKPPDVFFPPSDFGLALALRRQEALALLQLFNLAMTASNTTDADRVCLTVTGYPSLPLTLAKESTTQAPTG